MRRSLSLARLTERDRFDNAGLSRFESNVNPTCGAEVGYTAYSVLGATEL